MPSPSSDTHIPVQRSRKSRCLRGEKSFTLLKPPSLSRASWLCCILVCQFGLEILNAPILVRKQELCRGLCGHRPGEIVTLAQLAAEITERHPLLVMLNTFSNNR